MATPNVYVRFLNKKDAEAALEMDDLSGFCLGQWIDDSYDYSWGIFENNNLIGYCSTGYADDCNEYIDKHPLHTNDSLLLSDVFIRREYRNQGYGLKLITDAIAKRWELDGKKNVVYCSLMREELEKFYGKAGFRMIETGDPFYMEMYLDPNDLIKKET